jgi:malonyl CoA-acyl carrier protein transacylase
MTIKNSDIAIIGLSGRFPGANNIDAFWQNLRDGIESISFFSDEELELVDRSVLSHPNYVKAGAILPNIDKFDASFFGYSSREAELIDPQQRILLECAWSALENAGYDPGTYKGLVGVYAGSSTNNYLINNIYTNQRFSQWRTFLEPTLALQVELANEKDYLPTRISYKLNLTGPSVNIQTACSTSLVAVHTACQSLLNGECDMAIAGGVSISVPQKTGYLYQEDMTGSPDGHCCAFDAQARGTIFGSGAGIVVLKLLHEAIADGDNIYAVIKGSAINNDGSLKLGFTAPSIEGQAAVISDALAISEIDADTVTYVETHGTATVLGDPIEITALTQAFRKSTEKKGFCAIGSVKTNIGHIQQAAGIAGLIKTVLALKHKLLPPSLHFREPNPKIDFANSPFYVNTALSEWQTNGTPRRAGVSSFGMGGTNCHVVLEEAPQIEPATNTFERDWHILCLSAKTEKALHELQQRYVTYLKSQKYPKLADICFTANTGRKPFNHRLAIVAQSVKELMEQLSAGATGSREGTSSPEARIACGCDSFAFLFTGQGSQYVNMGRQLYEQAPTFRETIDRCDEILRPYLEVPLLEILYPDSDTNNTKLDETAYTQPALFALEYALFQLWKSWGIEPDVVMGHSVGEYVAACVAGVFSLEDALKLIAARGRLMQALPTDGEMVALLTDEAQAFAAIEPYSQFVSIAAINGPESVVISGQREAIDAVCVMLEASGIKAKKLNVSHAFHSPLMEPMLEDFEEITREVSFSSPQIKLISNVTGTLVTEEVATPEYWCRHILQPVRFAASIESLVRMGVEAFVEIGPKPILLGMGCACLPDGKGLWLPSLRSGQDDWQVLLSSLAELYVHRVPLDWFGFDQNYIRHRLPLPTYPFQRQRCWIEAAQHGYSTSTLKRENGAKSQNLHPLLGQQLYLAGTTEIRFQSQISQNSPAWVKDHRVFGTTILPGTAYLEMALSAGALVAKSDKIWLEEVVFQQALILPENGEEKTIQLILTPTENLTYSFQIFSLTSSSDADNDKPFFSLHASGKLLVKEKEAVAEQVDLTAMQAQYTQEISIETVYRGFQEQRIDYGSSFRGLVQLFLHEGTALGKIRLPEELVPEIGNYQLHPVLLDICTHVAEAISPDEVKQNTYVPVGLERLHKSGRADTHIWCQAHERKVQGDNKQTWSVDFRLFNLSGELIATLEGLQLKQVSQDAMLSSPQSSWKDWLYEVEWRPQARYGTLPDYLPNPKAVGDRLQTRLSQSLAQSSLTIYREALTKLEALSVAYILVALEEMGWLWQPKHRFATNQIVEQLGVVSQHQRLLGRLLEILAEVGILQRSGSQWEVISVPEIGDAQHMITSLSYPEAEAEITLLERCGPRLAQVLRGERDPLQLLFPAGDTTTVTKLYQDSPTARLMNNLVQEAVLSAQERLPQGRGWRILEIGAGTGSTTNYILPHLFTEQTEYVFTDIGAFFTAKAQEKFKDYPFIRYQVLDIEQYPLSQGFEPHQYDVIVAANVLHATSDLRASLLHVKQLLAPGGMLVLLEDMVPQHWVDLTFGLTEGWWKFSDRQLRPDYPLLSASQWETLLQEIGFEQAVTISPDDVEIPDKKVCLPSAVIVAFAEAKQQVSSPPHRVILADGQGIGQQLAAHLRSQGENCTLVVPGKEYEQIAPFEFRIDPANPKHFQQLFVALPEVGAIVHLWSLDAPEALTVDDLESALKLSCGSMLHLVHELVKRYSKLPRLWLVTRGAQAVQGLHLPGIAQSPLWGMGKVIALEHPESKCTTIDLDLQATENEVQNLCEEISQKDTEYQVAFRDQTRYAARLVRRRRSPSIKGATQLKIPENQPFRLGVSKRGTLENLQLQKTTRRHPGTGEVEIRVRAAGLNFRDVLNALGLYPGEPPLGSECAGVVVAVGTLVEGIEIEDDVVALTNGSLSLYVTVNANLVVPKPAALTFEEAATIPVAFLTAYWCLHRVAKIAPQDRVLIHAATGGVGQAAVQLTQKAGAEVFGTTSPSKWQVLKSLGVKYVMNSRRLDFAEEVMAHTNGEGVDIVLNSLTGEGFIQKSLEVVSEQGSFIELGKRDIWSASQVGNLRPDVSYNIVDLGSVEQEQPVLIGSLLHQLMQQFESGSLQPLAQTVFPIQEAVSAFRYMQQAKHTGKIIITFPEQVKGQQPVTVRGDRSYLITGGLGGLGLVVARWLVERGAKNLVLVGRSEPSIDVKSQLRELESQGARIVVAKADVADREQMALVLGEIETSLAPLRGIIHAAGVLDDGIVLQQNWERFARVLNPKVKGAWNLHQLTQKQPLDFFVLFSSVASLLGSAGQSNHSSANAFLDALAFYRRSQKLPGMSINWGAWSDIGAAARNQEAMKLNEKMGMGAICPQQGLQVLEQLLTQIPVQVGVMPINWSQFKGQMANSSFFKEVSSVSQEPSKPPTQLEFRQVLEQATVPERKAMLASYVSSQVAQVLGWKGSESIDWTCGFFALGMDSLSSIELRNRLQTSLGCSLSTTLTFDYPTVEALVTYLVEEVFSEALSMESHEDSEVLNPTLTQMQQLSESEAEALLIKELDNMNY